MVRQSLSLGRPMVINISFGNNYGSHKGDSLLETYIDMVSSTGRLVICTGTGNNGNQPLHEGGILKQGQTRQIELSVSSREPTLNVQLWKSYEDEMSIYIENPSGNRIGPLDEKLGPQRYRRGNTELLIYLWQTWPLSSDTGNLHRFPSCGNLCGQWRLENHLKWKKRSGEENITCGCQVEIP